MIWCVEDDASIRDIELYALTSISSRAPPGSRPARDSASSPADRPSRRAALFHTFYE